MERSIKSFCWHQMMFTKFDPKLIYVVSLFALRWNQLLSLYSLPIIQYVHNSDTEHIIIKSLFIICRPIEQMSYVVNLTPEFSVTPMGIINMSLTWIQDITIYQSIYHLLKTYTRFLPFPSILYTLQQKLGSPNMSTAQQMLLTYCLWLGEKRSFVWWNIVYEETGVWLVLGLKPLEVGFSTITLPFWLIIACHKIPL